MFWMVSAIPIFWHTPSVKFSQSDILTSVRAHKMTRNARWQSRRSRYKAAAHVPNFDILAPAPELSLVEAINIPFRNMTTQLYRERQLWSGSENVKIGYVSGSFVAGTSASYPGVPRQMTPPVKKAVLRSKSETQESYHWSVGQIVTSKITQNI